ncbi:MAG: glycerol dehydrogenase [Actinomycetia bacterium]|nr:glycerol dehydrogenase [Actinomycetes bacterium]
MEKILGAPGRYIQGPGALAHLGKYVAPLGKKATAVISQTGKARVGDAIASGMKDAGVEFEFFEFGGECSMNEINRIMASAKAFGSDVILAVGGGKIIDAAKGAAYYMDNAPVGICPTIASTDAPCSALTVVYTDDGVFESYLFLTTNPTFVLVDTAVVAQAPSRLLVSGMGDALATFLEAKTCVAKNADNFLGGKSTMSALTLAELCFRTLISDGLKAKLALDAGGALTPAVEKVVEANTLLSGIGFESCGLAAAHAIHNGFTAAEETHSYYHGEKVSFGVVVNMVLENYPTDELEEIIRFQKSVGLPVTLAEIGITEPDEGKLRAIAALANAEGDTLGNMVVPVTDEDVYNAILAADKLGQSIA